MSRAYFVSDLHLTASDDDRAALFVRFLDDVAADSEASHLILLGDVFDMWLADHRYFIDKFRDVVDAIVEVRDQGIEIHYFEGNHDLHLQRYWGDELGLEVHADPIHVDIAGKALRLEHGDQMDPDDRGYRFLRWLLRTPPMRFLIHHLPGNFVARLGERASATSRTYTSETKTIARDVAIDKIRSHAGHRHAECPFDLIVSGHVHIRDDYTDETANGPYRSINLGTWLDRPVCLILDDSGVRLVELDTVSMAESPQATLATEST